jgi:hypothetical protein
MLFTERGIWTMIHGVVLGGGVLMGLCAALFAMGTVRAPGAAHDTMHDSSRALVRLLVSVAAVLWLTVLVGTYVNFPPYRATPPEGTLDLSQYPRFLIDSNPETVWLHAFGMEIKEHVPWIASMLATAVAFVGLRYRSRLLSDARLRSMSMTLLALCFVLSAFVGIMGIFVNKVAPLQ